MHPVSSHSAVSSCPCAPVPCRALSYLDAQSLNVVPSSASCAVSSHSDRLAVFCPLAQQLPGVGLFATLDPDVVQLPSASASTCSGSSSTIRTLAIRAVVALAVWQLFTVCGLPSVTGRPGAQQSGGDGKTEDLIQKRASTTMNAWAAAKAAHDSVIASVCHHLRCDRRTYTCHPMPVLLQNVPSLTCAAHVTDVIAGIRYRLCWAPQASCKSALRRIAVRTWTASLWRPWT